MFSLHQAILRLTGPVFVMLFQHQQQRRRRQRATTTITTATATVITTNYIYAIFDQWFIFDPSNSVTIWCLCITRAKKALCQAFSVNETKTFSGRCWERCSFIPMFTIGHHRYEQTNPSIWKNQRDADLATSQQHCSFNSLRSSDAYMRQQTYHH